MRLATTTKKGKDRPAAAPPRGRLGSFVFEGVPEKDRFGVFDPTLRGLFLVALMFAAVFGVGWLFDASKGGGQPLAEAGTVVALVAILGFVGYRRIWKKPRERDVLLKMAAADEETRARTAARARARASKRK